MKIIRDATIEDIDCLMEIQNDCFINPYKQKDIEYELLKNPINQYLVIVIDNQIIGFIDFMITFNSATINQIAVKKEYRHQGYARELLDAMEQRFIKSGEDIVENVTLEVRESNVKAINLYEKNGYEKITTKKAYYSDGENAIYMLKRLI